MQHGSEAYFSPKPCWWDRPRQSARSWIGAQDNVLSRASKQQGCLQIAAGGCFFARCVEGGRGEDILEGFLKVAEKL